MGGGWMYYHIEAGMHRISPANPCRWTPNVSLQVVSASEHSPPHYMHSYTHTDKQVDIHALSFEDH